MLQKNPDAEWWRQAVIYQIYPRSFADANGDGIGDLKGITAKVPYLQALSIDAVWLSPFYPSALKDGGYDVADYRDVDPKIGTLADFDEMLEALREAGIKVIVDIVPNHSSDDHEWFQAALRAGKGSPERERYIFRDGLGPNKDQPPTDWQSTFGGPSWSPSGLDDGQWYFHQFDTSQPDFNWDNQDVKDDFLKTLRFWGDRGVAGFRVDVAQGITKDMSEPLPIWEKLVEMSRLKVQNGNAHLIHPLLDRDETQEIFRSWRKVFNEYDPPLIAVAECWVAPDRKYLYASSSGLGQAFSFDMLLCNFDAKEYRTCIEHSLQANKDTGSSTTWVLSNHDVVRHVSRYGMPNVSGNDNHKHFVGQCNEWLLSEFKNPAVDLKKGLRRARATTLLLLSLPGSTYLYQGEELGLPEVIEIPDEQRQDPSFFRTKGTKAPEVGRDGCRVPLPWEATGKNFGFGNGKPAHLPQPEYFGKYAVAVEEQDETSTLQLYRQAIDLRRDLQTAEELEWIESGDPEVLHFKRPGGWEVVFNTSTRSVPLPRGKVLISSTVDRLVDGVIPGESAVWLQTIA